MFHAWRILLGSLVKWILLSIVIGGVIGVIASAFANLIAWATDFRMGHMWMVYLLPFAGLMIVFLYHVTGQEKNAGTDMVLMVVRSDQNTMPGDLRKIHRALPQGGRGGECARRGYVRSPAR